MSTGPTTPDPAGSPDPDDLRAEADRLRTEVESTIRAQAQPTDEEPGAAAEQTAQLIGSPLIAGQYNSADASTVLECTVPAGTLVLLNNAQGTAATGAPIGLYALAQGVGIIVTAYGTPPFPVRSKAVQAWCQHGEAIFAQSMDGAAVYAHTANGDAAVIADQGGAGPRSTAVTALGGNGIGVYASGATASVQLGRSSTAGPPTSGAHEAGELVLDANADLHLCKASGTPGTWSQIG